MAFKIDPVASVDDYGKHPYYYNESIQAMGNALIGRIQKIMEASNMLLDSVPNDYNMIDHDQTRCVMVANKTLSDYHTVMYMSVKRLLSVKIPEVARNGDSLADDLKSMSLNGVKASPFLTPPNGPRSPEESRGRNGMEDRECDESSQGSKRMKVIKNGSVCSSSICEVSVTNLSPEEWTNMYLMMPPKTRSGSVYCTISFAESLDSFYIICDQETSNELHSQLQSSIRKMKKAGMNGLDMDQVNKGTLCAAVYSEDGTYYRALIEHVKEESVDVYFIDYGNREEVKFTDLMPLDDFLRQGYPTQCIKCILENYSSIPDEASALAKFKAITSARNHYIKATFLESVRRQAAYFWRNLFSESICINPRMISLSYSTKSEPKKWFNILEQLY